MKESISYSFLLNIVIIFIFVCAAIIMGIFSYYKAFRANTIIVNAIEKFEGFNCMSQEEAAMKLSSIGYNVPFEVKCKNSWDKPCMTDNNNNYAVISYNLDDYNRISDSFYTSNNEMNSMLYYCKDDDYNNCTHTERYQYGVYTYMYVDLPVISSVARIPFFSKTKVMHEFRDLGKANEKNITYDVNNIPKDVIEYSYTNSSIKTNSYAEKFANILLVEANLSDIFDADEYVPFEQVYMTEDVDVREIYKRNFVNNIDPSIYKGQFLSTTVLSGYNLDCGVKIDYSKY